MEVITGRPSTDKESVKHKDAVRQVKHLERMVELLEGFTDLVEVGDRNVEKAVRDTSTAPSQPELSLLEFLNQLPTVLLNMSDRLSTVHSRLSEYLF